MGVKDGEQGEWKVGRMGCLLQPAHLEQTRKGLENVTGSYLQQLAGIEIVGDIYLTELTDPGDGGK